MLRYKCESAKVLFEEVSERFTTQICSSCGEITASSPKGRIDLRIRVWECECGAVNQRDCNAAKNILALGHKRLAVGIPVLLVGEDVKRISYGSNGLRTSCKQYEIQHHEWQSGTA